MNARILKWFVIVVFAITALTGCYVHYHDRDDYYYHGYRHYDRDDGHYRH